MQNHITEKQNTDEFLEYLAASSYLYSNVKTVIGFQIILTVAVPILFSILSILYPDTFKIPAALYGLFISLFDTTVLEKLQKDWKKEAAKVQECFDCRLFGLKWNNFRVGDKIAPEKIQKASTSYFSKNSDSELRNWYSVHIEELPLQFARLMCQRNSVYWDFELRGRFTVWLIVLGLALFILGLVIAVALNFTVTNYIITILVPIFPTFSWLIREIKRQYESKTTLDRLIKYIGQLWEGILQNKFSDEELEVKSRELQDEIYTHRNSNQPIFNWIYKKSRSQQESQMNEVVKKLVKELRESLNP